MRLLRTIRSVDFTGQERAALNKLTMPRRLITDKLRSYSAAHRTVMPSVIHSTQQYENNRAEVSHQSTRQRERQLRRFQVGRPSATVRLGARRRPESLPGRTSPAPGSSPPSLEGPFVPSVG